MKRTPLRKVSKKKAKENRETAKPRRDLRHEIGQCAYCGYYRQQEQLAVHEIYGASQRSKAVRDRGAQLIVCRFGECHAIVQALPKVEQYAMKVVQDPEFFDRERLNAYAGRGEKVSEKELLLEVVALLGG